MASLLEQMIEAQRRERNKNVLPVGAQSKPIQSMLHMAQSYANASDEIYVGRNARGHVFATSNQIDIDGQIAGRIRLMSKKELLTVAIFCATSQNEKAGKVLIKKIQRQVGTINQDDFNYIIALVDKNIDKELVARVYHYLCDKISGFKTYFMKYCAYYQGF
ncbi:MAG: hypothetical protein IJA72_05040 [Clostridia bacterium]|nr:hypothetical protein [Clostridia bacterium]